MKIVLVEIHRFKENFNKGKRDEHNGIRYFNSGTTIMKDSGAGKGQCEHFERSQREEKWKETVFSN